MQSFILATIFVIGIASMPVLSWPTVLLVSNQSETGMKNTTRQSTLEKDLTITSQQKRVLDKFRKRVSHRLTKDFMKGDLWLVRWLRARDFDIRKAEEMLLTSLEWRKKNRIDGIQEEDWSKFTKQYPYFLSTHDKEGKPILYIHPAQWDLRSIALSDQSKRFQRYIEKGIDDLWEKLYEMQTKYQNVSQAVAIINLDGYNVVQHACLKCIPIILRGILTYERHYPGMAFKIFVVNTPSSFEPLLQTIRTVLSPPTEKALRIYGMSKAEWKPILQKYIDIDQIPKELGGTFDTNVDEDY